MRTYRFLENCTEANYKISDGKEIYNCTKCKMDFDLVCNETTKITECLYNDTKAYENSNQTNIVIPDSDTTDKPISDTTDKTDIGTTDKQDSDTTDKPISDTTDKPDSDTTDKPDNGTTDKPISGTTDKPISGTTLKPDNATTDKSISGTTDKPISGTTDKPDSGNDGNCGPGKEYNKAYNRCIELMDRAPIITWKDIFGFKRSYTKIINGRTYKGPSVKLRGLTSDKISQHHSFIIILIFRIFGLRNLEEDKEIEAVCEIENGKSNDKANLVDFECIANETIKDNMELNDIKSDDQKIGTLKLDNLKATDSSYNPIIFRTKRTLSINNK